MDNGYIQLAQLANMSMMMRVMKTDASCLLAGRM